MKFYAKKIIELHSADIHLHYANNKGRGSDNVTVTIVKSGSQRPDYTKKYDERFIISQYRTSGWVGNVNIPNSIIQKYGGLK